MEIKCLKSAITLFFKVNLIAPCLGLSNEVLCILEAQEAAKIIVVKFGDTKKNEPEPGHTRVVWIGLSSRIFIRPPTLTVGSFAVP